MNTNPRPGDNVLYSPRQSAENPLLLVGTYTEPDESKSEGVYVYRMDPASGELSYQAVIPGLPNVSYMAVHPRLRLIYAVSETEEFDGKPGGGVSVISSDSSGAFHIIDHQPSGGQNPAYISIDHSGRFALIANYKSGTISLLPITPDGHLNTPSNVVQHIGSSADTERQEGPHPHCVIPDPTNRFVLAADLGADKLFIYHLDLDEGQLHNHTEVELDARAGPRHLLFDSTGRRLYLINELNSTIILYNYDPATGTLDQQQTVSTLPELFDERNLCGDFHLSSHGKHLYVSNRGHDSIVCFNVNPKNGELTYQSHIPSNGHEPRILELDPSGRFLVAAHQKSRNAVVYRIDEETGDLTPTGYEAQLDMPVHVLFI
jgi:6-phosphogluconolactonase